MGASGHVLPHSRKGDVLAQDMYTRAHKSNAGMAALFSD